MAIRRAFAQEDTNLQTATVSTSRLVDYKDIDLVFKAKADSGEIFKKTEANAVKQAVKTLVMTNFMEKPFNPDFGCDIVCSFRRQNGSSSSSSTINPKL